MFWEYRDLILCPDSVSCWWGLCVRKCRSWRRRDGGFPDARRLSLSFLFALCAQLASFGTKASEGIEFDPQIVKMWFIHAAVTQHMIFFSVQPDSFPLSILIELLLYVGIYQYRHTSYVHMYNIWVWLGYYETRIWRYESFNIYVCMYVRYKCL